MSIFEALREQIPVGRLEQANGGKTHLANPAHQDPTRAYLGLRFGSSTTQDQGCLHRAGHIHLARFTEQVHGAEQQPAVDLGVAKHPQREWAWWEYRDLKGFTGPDRVILISRLGGARRLAP